MTITGRSSRGRSTPAQQRRTLHPVHCRSVGSNSHEYVGRYFLCRSFQSSDTAAPNPTQPEQTMMISDVALKTTKRHKLNTQAQYAVNK